MGSTPSKQRKAYLERAPSLPPADLTFSNRDSSPYAALDLGLDASIDSTSHAVEKPYLDRRMSLMDLNMDVLVIILSFLTTRGLRRLALTSRACHGMTLVDMLDTVVLRSSQQAHGFCLFMLKDPSHRIPLLHSLTIRLNPTALSSILTGPESDLGTLLTDLLFQSENLTSLSIDNIDWVLMTYPTVSHAITSRSSHLRGLSMTYPGSHTLLMLQQMKGLRITSISFPSTDTGIAPFLLPFSSTLQTLHIHHHHQFSFEWYDYQWPVLHTLTISSPCHHLKSQLFSNFPNLRRLHIEGDMRGIGIDDLIRVQNLSYPICWAELEVVKGLMTRICTLGLTCRVKRMEMDSDAPGALSHTGSEHDAFIECLQRTSPEVLKFGLYASHRAPMLFMKLAKATPSLKFLHVSFFDAGTCRKTLDCLNKIIDLFSSLTYLSLHVYNQQGSEVDVTMVDAALIKIYPPVLARAMPLLSHLEVQVGEKQSYWKIFRENGKVKVKRLDAYRGGMARKAAMEV
ncbi:hypothetical protein JAAARDRAFT_36356 [Jaapia argillacea MUCL 33604]|uniref:F-box domain-containing protein n=1 Tax=Jaapia argillacea MUCL 33604 TaxID=933084 RepID=A0A067PSS5_9AGAM|nr:hypothetical protein JAAARDRAFT_36356 [Jaapia argillacea MUCL 33604]